MNTETDFTRFNVNATLFARVALAQSSEQTRFYLCGVSIELAPHGMPGVTITATNGAHLVSAYDAEGTTTGSVVVNAPPHILKACKPWKNKKEPRLIGDNGTIVVMDTGGTEQIARGTTVDGSFPEWRRAVPQPEGVAYNYGISCAVFAPEMLATLAKAMISGKSDGLIIRGATHTAAHLVWGDDARMIGVAMPFRDPKTARATLPDWALICPATPESVAD